MVQLIRRTLKCEKHIPCPGTEGKPYEVFLDDWKHWFPVTREQVMEEVREFNLTLEPDDPAVLEELSKEAS